MINTRRHKKDTQETSCSCSLEVGWLLVHARTRKPTHLLNTRFHFLVNLQDVEGDSDDDIPELEEQGGGEDSAEVRRRFSFDSIVSHGTRHT